MHFTCHYDFSGVTVLGEWWRINHLTLAFVQSTVVGCGFKLTREQTICMIRLLRRGRENERWSLILRDIHFQKKYWKKY